ncbi:MAG TPA: hypothetical protein VNK91_06970 [Burkholderiaceae bacterium]|nr:hypothetical protein [Burkholderiaceae bacterium]
MNGGAPSRKEYVAGYSGILVRSDIKARLHAFRASLGLRAEPSVERCLATAALEVVLEDRSLVSSLLARFKSAAERDYELLTRSALSAAQERAAETPDVQRNQGG